MTRSIRPILSRPVALAAAVVVLPLAIGVGTSAADTTPSAQGSTMEAAHHKTPPSAEWKDLTHFALTGDTPYGDAQNEIFPTWLKELGDDDELGFIGHMGDTKTGSSKCSDEYNKNIFTMFNAAQHPFVYTPGDNEWTDCHREKAGQYYPLERLTELRELMFPKAGHTLGKDATVTVSDELYPENVRYFGGGIEFATLHVVGSNNGRLPWKGLGKTNPTTEQLVEEEARMHSTIHHLEAAFRDAHHRDARAVVLMQQADLFDKYTVEKKTYTAFKPLVNKLVKLTKKFDKPVYLVMGDSHKYNAGYQPLVKGSEWLDRYCTKPVKNLTAIVVPGEKEAINWLKFTIHPDDAKKPLTWEKKAYQAQLPTQP